MVRIPRSQMEKALEHLSRGGIVIFPTDTVYGLGCGVGQVRAIEQIFVLKNRPPDRPLQLLLSDADRVGEYAARVPAYGRKLMEKHWPGGLTILLSAVEGLPRHLTGSEGKVGLRVPDLTDLRELISRSGGALAATSANVSEQRSPWSVGDIPQQIRSRVDYVIDAGPLRSVPSSTVVDCTSERPRVLRRGAVDPGPFEQASAKV